MFRAFKLTNMHNNYEWFTVTYIILNEHWHNLELTTTSIFTNFLLLWLSLNFIDYVGELIHEFTYPQIKMFINLQMSIDYTQFK